MGLERSVRFRLVDIVYSKMGVLSLGIEGKALGAPLMEEEDSMVTACGWAYTLLHSPYKTRVSADAAAPDMARFSWVTQDGGSCPDLWLTCVPVTGP